MTQATTIIEAPKKRSLKLRTIGFIALGFCALGYAGFVATVFAIKADMIAMGAGLGIAGVFAVVGEAGLWIGAASLGLSFYARRRERVARFFGRVKSAFSSKS
ncbi:hypothetical protein [Brevundimonas sp.]|uniref:hypothetical protein n=1 Tax=Brevundimonas sp. TaxID=1871086 RepID=UPI00289F5FEA|nr:hypothetical protein [Brevundimonas sp.]